MTLREKKLDFDSVALDYSKEETRGAAYLAKTITGRVPRLVHDDFGLGRRAGGVTALLLFTRSFAMAAALARLLRALGMTDQTKPRAPTDHLPGGLKLT